LFYNKYQRLRVCLRVSPCIICILWVMSKTVLC
jgi:hypothetical protein